MAKTFKKKNKEPGGRAKQKLFSAKRILLCNKKKTEATKLCNKLYMKVNFAKEFNMENIISAENLIFTKS